MTSVRVLVGTRKGAFILTADAARKNWTITEPLFGGWEVYHIAGSPVDPNRLYASQSSDWFGQIIQRSDDGGESWNPVGNEFAYDASRIHISGMTRRRILGSSKESGIWSRIYTT